MSSKIRERLLAMLIGVAALLTLTFLIRFHPGEVVDAATSAGGAAFWIAFRTSEALRRFVIGVLAFLLGGVLLVMLHRFAPGYAGPVSLLGLVCFMAWLVFDTSLTAAEKQRIASFLMRAFGAALLLLVLLPLFVRGGVLAALAIWVINGVLFVWYAVTGEWPFQAASQPPPDAWRWHRDKDGTWRA